MARPAALQNARERWGRAAFLAGGESALLARLYARVRRLERLREAAARAMPLRLDTLLALDADYAMTTSEIYRLEAEEAEAARRR
ncbi:MAG: hypothetical protein AAF317_16175 [Pseudomonadota bacterium]